MLKLFTLADKSVPTAGTRVALKASTFPAYKVFIQAKHSNTGKIYVGDDAVSSSQNAKTLAAGEVFELTAGHVNLRGQEEIDLADIYIDAQTNGEGVHIGYTFKK